MNTNNSNEAISQEERASAVTTDVPTVPKANTPEAQADRDRRKAERAAKEKARIEDPQGKDFNRALAGRTIESVEMGTSPGWIVLNLSITEAERKEAPEGGRLFLAIYVGGEKPYCHDDHHFWTAALHEKGPKPRDGSRVSPLRDNRDPEMPTAMIRTPTDALAQAKREDECLQGLLAQWGLQEDGPDDKDVR